MTSPDELGRIVANNLRDDVEAELAKLNIASEEGKRLSALVVSQSAEVLVRRMAGMPSLIMETALKGTKDALVSAAGEAALGGVQNVLAAALRRAAQGLILGALQ